MTHQSPKTHRDPPEPHLLDDGFLVEPEPPERVPWQGWERPVVTTRRRDLFLAVIATAILLAVVALLASGGFRRADAEEEAVGTAIYTAEATWCAPTPDYCQDWGGNARLAAVNSFRFGDEPYWVRITRGDASADALVVSYCACHNEHGYIDVSPAVFEVLAPLSLGRIDVVVEVLTDLPPHPDDERMRDEVRDALPQTDTIR